MFTKNKNWVDVTLPIHTDMISWPTDPSVKISAYKGINDGMTSNVSLLSFGSHTGTHIDAPRHFFNNGITIDAMPADVMVGFARVIEIKDPSVVRLEEIKSKKICPGQRIFFQTQNSKARWWMKGFSKKFVSLTLAAAEYLVSRRIKLIGIDCLSVGGYGKTDGAAVHRILLNSGIWIVEGLDLGRVSPGRYDMLCLPVRIYQGDAAPTRVLLRMRK